MTTVYRRPVTSAGAWILRNFQRQCAPAPPTKAMSQLPLNSSYQTRLPTQIIPSRAFSSKETVKITYIDPNGEERVVDAEVGKHLMDVAHDNNIELEGACGGELACSTCHLVFEKDVYDTLPPKSDEEEDMLDLAMELTETSRLGCQIRVTKDLDGIKVRIPDDGY